ncbi:hypothetical protein DM01DRAFT_1336877 [Hesseltinella vesiculosa]|uniref:RRM domain-containing protein n=1 Tax=Hesseltinella vesiculosa TaxID=101127 RepID=A0A1X2GEE0_9FUNG|nr:hypothetical protein DM01DRAFT_1336877 [Hesseltinella vesiculosa]
MDLDSPWDNNSRHGYHRSQRGSAPRSSNHQRERQLPRGPRRDRRGSPVRSRPLHTSSPRSIQSARSSAPTTRTGINARLGSGSPSILDRLGSRSGRPIQKAGPTIKNLTTAALRQQAKDRQSPPAPAKEARSHYPSAAADPSQIFITKRVGRRDRDQNVQLLAQPNAPYYPQTAQHQEQPQPASGMSSFFTHTNTAAPQISPMEHTSNPMSIHNTSFTGLSIRGEAGPAYVLISNLDRHATEADLATACSRFGKVTACDVFYDRHGYSLGEAEVEFETKASALQCIRVLDNESVDGKTIHVTLRERPVSKNMQANAQQRNPTVRSTLAGGIFGGKMYSDQ